MYELIQVGERTYTIECPSRMGVYDLGAGEALLIDSGNDRQSAKKALGLLESKGWHLACVLNTHSHADHIGGNAHLQQVTGCRVLAPAEECPFIQHPQLEGALLYGGSPVKELKTKFLCAHASAPQPLPSQLPGGIAPIPLPGHSPGMTGYLTPDGVAFLGDAVLGEEALGKYHVNYLYDPGAFLASLHALEGLSAQLYLPAHAAAQRTIGPLAARNRDNALEILELIGVLLAQPLSFEQLLQAVMDHYHLSLNFGQYGLIGSTLRSYLSFLHNQDRVAARFEDNRLIWQLTH